MYWLLHIKMPANVSWFVRTAMVCSSHKARSMVLFCAVLVLGRCAGLAHADSFVGTWEVDWYSDFNIQDGVTIIESHTTASATRPDPQHVTLTDVNGSVTLFQDGDILRIESPPLDVGTGLWLAAYAMSDGTNTAWLHVGQEYEDPNDISVTLGVSTASTASVSPANLVGYWEFDRIHHPNVRNIADVPSEPFERDTSLWEITDLGGNHLQIDAVGYGTFGVVELVGNRLSMVTMNPSADYHAFELATDGDALSFLWVASETYDATDVCVSIGLGQKVPEPATLALLALGSLALIRRRRTA